MFSYKIELLRITLDLKNYKKCVASKIYTQVHYIVYS